MPYLLIAPAIILIIVFRVLPLAMVAGLSLFETNFIETTFVGLDNYRHIFATPELWQAIPNTGWYVVAIVPATIILSVLIAMIAHRESNRFQHAVRFFFYLPSLVSGIVLATVWRWIWHYDGPINALVMKLGGERVQWFGNRLTSIGPISMIDVTMGVGFFVIILIAALKSIPESHYDTAKIEGARRWQTMRYVMAPAIAPTIALVAILKLSATVQFFGWIYMLAPYRYAATMMYSIFHEGFLYGRFGVASAYSVILMAITSVLVVAQRRIRRW